MVNYHLQNQKKQHKDNKNNIENLIGKSKDQTLKASSDKNKSLEKTVLGKIKNN